MKPDVAFTAGVLAGVVLGFLLCVRLVSLPPAGGGVRGERRSGDGPIIPPTGGCGTEPPKSQRHPAPPADFDGLQAMRRDIEGRFGAAERGLQSPAGREPEPYHAS